MALRYPHVHWKSKIIVFRFLKVGFSLHCGTGQSTTTVLSPDLIMFTVFFLVATVSSGPGPSH